MESLEFIHVTCVQFSAHTSGIFLLSNSALFGKIYSLYIYKFYGKGCYPLGNLGRFIKQIRFYINIDQNGGVLYLTQEGE
jgi:hypothetical protein